jgi:2-polyprenyl-6-methoxyphenol hydroxylase-like FAD-dependent oxidoreductase
LGTGVTAHFSHVGTAQQQPAVSSSDSSPIAPVHAAVLIGADGIFSRLAKQRMASEHTGLTYTGVLVVLGIAQYTTAAAAAAGRSTTDAASTEEETERVGEEQGQYLSQHELLRNGTTISETVDGSTRLCKI